MKERPVSVANADAIRLRPIRIEDNLQVAQLIHRVMAEHGCVGAGYSCEDAEVSEMYQAYDHVRSVFFVLEYETEILGCGGIAPLAGCEQEVCELRKMYFDVRMRGLGWGRKLVTICLERARSLGYQNCYLETVARMETANTLYQRMGFQRLKSAWGNTGHFGCDRAYVIELAESD